MTKHPCAGMTKAQREAFERIAVNQPPIATHKTLLALRAKGLIGYTDKVVGRDALGKITVPEWFVPLHAHIQWCEWCSQNVTERHKFQLWQRGVLVAAVDCTDRHSALKEIAHYAAIYEQDGPIKIVEVSHEPA